MLGGQNAKTCCYGRIDMKTKERENKYENCWHDFSTWHQRFNNSHYIKKIINKIRMEFTKWDPCSHINNEHTDGIPSSFLNVICWLQWENIYMKKNSTYYLASMHHTQKSVNMVRIIAYDSFRSVSNERPIVCFFHYCIYVFLLHHHSLL